MPNYKSLKERLSEIGQKKANARWSKYHEDQPIRSPDKWEAWPYDMPMRTVIVRDHFTDMTHTLHLFKGRSLDSFNIDVDGKFWKIGGWTRALEKVRKSCVRIMRGD